METPSYSHFTLKDYENIYEPSEDTFLLIDALEIELPFLKAKQPLICLELGSGSGIVISALSKYLNYQTHGFFAVDISKFACDATLRTRKANSVQVEILNMDLLSAFKPNSIDLLVFNPPYVPTPSNPIENNIPEQNKFYDIEAENVYSSHNKMLIKTWAGGAHGCEIINRVISILPDVLAPDGIFYLLIIKENNPALIIEDLRNRGFQAVQLIDRKIRGEHLIVLKISRV